MPTIHKIGEEYLNLANEIIANEGELTPELETALAINREQLELKAVAYGYVVKQTQHDIKGIEEEIKRLQALKKASENLIDRLKLTVKGAMELYNIKQIRLNNLLVFKKTTKSTEIDDESLIPAEYKTTKTEIVTSKTKIKEAIEAGIEVPGAHLQTNVNVQFQ